MIIELYQIDAFTDHIFGGNPAAICPLKEWLNDDIMLKIAQENNLAETAFFISLPNGRYHLRWFTPEIEMDLCGHATLATAYVLFEELGHDSEQLEFETLSGILTVSKQEKLYELNFPSRPPEKAILPDTIKEGLNLQPKEVWKARDYLLLYDHQDDILAIEPNVSILNQINIDPGGIIITAPSSNESIDFVSRFFTPQASVFEDPVTGSAHCTLTPFWANRLGKNDLKALQLSYRGGELQCKLEGDRVKISGKAIKYLKGQINFNPF